MKPSPFCLLVSGCILMSLAGCTAVPYRNALPEGAAGEIESTAVVVATAQHEIDTTINPSNMTAAAGGGLLWALVDAAANAHSAGKTDRLSADLRQALLDFSFEDTASAALAARFESGDPLTFSSFSVRRDTMVNDVATIVADTAGDAVVVASMRYFLDPQFTAVIVTADITVFPKSDALKARATQVPVGREKMPVIYRNAFQSYWPMPSELRPAENKRENNIQAWAASNGEPARTALDSACREIAAMLAWDLSQPGKPTYKPEGREAAVVTAYGGGAPLALRGAYVFTADNRGWAQLTDGRLYAQPL